MFCLGMKGGILCIMQYILIFTIYNNLLLLVQIHITSLHAWIVFMFFAFIIDKTRTYYNLDNLFRPL